MPSPRIVPWQICSAIVRARCTIWSIGGIGVLIVLWNLIALPLCRAQTPKLDTKQSLAQPRDSALHHAPTTLPQLTSSDSEAEVLFGSPHRTTIADYEKELYMILSGGIGFCGQFWSDGTYDTRFLPTAGIDFYVMPGGPFGFLLGGHTGFAPRFAYGVDLGIRVPIKGSMESRERWFLDGQLLFFNQGTDLFETGGRIALATGFGGPAIGEEIRLVGEYRGQETSSAGEVKPMFWTGIEAGISFSLIDQPKPRTHKDSLCVALSYIATSQELEDFDQLTSPEDLEGWMANFWLKREERVAGSNHDLEREFYSRVAIANERYSLPRREGVETDAGRMIVIYGVPDNQLTDYSPLDHGIRYMLWFYRQRVRGSSEAVVLFRSQNNMAWTQEFSSIAGEASGILPTDLPLSIQQALLPYLN